MERNNHNNSHNAKSVGLSESGGKKEVGVPQERTTIPYEQYKLTINSTRKR